MFNKEAGHVVEESKLRVVYVLPPGLVSDNGNLSGSESLPAIRTFVDPQDISAEVKALIAKLSEEKDSSIQQNNNLGQELELLKRQYSIIRLCLALVILIGWIGLFWHLTSVLKKA